MSWNSCPFCQSPDVTLEDTERSGDSIYETYSCQCGLSFVEVFEFSHMEDEDGRPVEVSE